MTNLTWAANGIGIALLPLSSVDCLGEHRLKYALIDEPDLLTGRAIIKMTGRYIPPVASSFFDFCYNYFLKQRTKE
jgi:DNA-binding transcriptional LysR family regulator